MPIMYTGRGTDGARLTHTPEQFLEIVQRDGTAEEQLETLRTDAEAEGDPELRRRLTFRAERMERLTLRQGWRQGSLEWWMELVGGGFVADEEAAQQALLDAQDGE